jgi:hypothetical protein
MKQWWPGTAATISGMCANNKRKLRCLIKRKRCVIKRKWHHRAPGPDIRSLGFVVGSLGCCRQPVSVAAVPLPYRATRSVLDSSASRPIDLAIKSARVRFSPLQPAPHLHTALDDCPLISSSCAFSYDFPRPKARCDHRRAMIRIGLKPAAKGPARTRADNPGQGNAS